VAVTDQDSGTSDVDPDVDPDLDPDVDPDLVPGRRPRPRVLVAVAVGGALGAAARYGVSQLLPPTAGRFPWATFWTNVSGAFALGFVLVVLIERYPPSTYVRPFVATGFLGGYTTFSTFAVDADLLVKDGHALTAAAYVAASVVVGLAAVTAGIRLARRVPAPRARPRPRPA
jgi:CrcB protein